MDSESRKLWCGLIYILGKIYVSILISRLRLFNEKYFIDIKDAEYYEKQIHKILDISRVNKNREFFKLPLDEIKSILKKLANSSHNYDTKMKMTEIKEAISND